MIFVELVLYCYPFILINCKLILFLFSALYDALVERLDILQTKPEVDGNITKFGKTTTYTFQVNNRDFQ